MYPMVKILEQSWLGCELRFEVLAVQDVSIDNAYQRIIAQSLVKKIVDEFMPECFDPPLVGIRDDGSMWAVDGQTRLTALSKKAIDKFPARTFRSRGRAHEAELFRKINQTRRSVKRFDIFRASLAAGDPATVEIDGVVERAGFKIGYSRTWPQIAAVAKLYDAHADGVLGKVLFAMAKAWPENTDILLEVPVGGLWQFFRRFPNAELPRCIDKWKKVGPTKLIQSADTAQMAGGSRYQAFALGLMHHYNLGLRTNRLEW
jgi:hypothetical protein